jgi:hypothetical protein
MKPHELENREKNKCKKEDNKKGKTQKGEKG